MEAFVDGIVIWENPDWPEIIVKCENGKTVKVDVNDNFDPEMPSIIGKEVEIQGKIYFSDGDFIIYAERISVSRNTTRPPFYDTYTT